jgi:cell division septum initiation protein DivIVA
LDVEAYIGQLEQLIAEARPMPLSSSIIVNKRDVDDVIAELRARLPDELRQARWIIKERDELLDAAAREAEQLMADTRVERDRMLSETEVVRAAQREAERIIEDAREQASILRLEAEDYVDGKLANFEIVLNKTLKAVEKGRERLRGRLATDELADGVDDPDEDDHLGPQPELYDYEQLAPEADER